MSELLALIDMLTEPPEQLDAGVHVDPRDKDPRDELTRQTILLRDLRLVAPAITVWAVPNAGKRSSWAAGKAKREGMTAGVPDLTLVWNRGVAFVEMKNGKDQPTPNQRDMLNLLHRAGHHCGVFRQADSCIAWLRSIGAPFLTREGRL